MSQNEYKYPRQGYTHECRGSCIVAGRLLLMHLMKKLDSAWPKTPPIPPHSWLDQVACRPKLREKWLPLVWSRQMERRLFLPHSEVRRWDTHRRMYVLVDRAVTSSSPCHLVNCRFRSMNGLLVGQESTRNTPAVLLQPQAEACEVPDTHSLSPIPAGLTNAVSISSWSEMKGIGPLLCK